MKIRRRRSRDRGAAMVEFALVVPLLLAIVFGIISFSYMLSFRGAMSQAAVEGARAAAIAPPGKSDDDLKKRAADAVTQSLGGYSDLTCAPPQLLDGTKVVGECVVDLPATCNASDGGNTASVKVVHRYRDNALVPAFPGFGITLPDEISFCSVVEVS